MTYILVVLDVKFKHSVPDLQHVCLASLGDRGREGTNIELLLLGEGQFSHHPLPLCLEVLIVA